MFLHSKFISLLLILLIAAGTLGYLDKTGFWSEVNKAKRELVRQKIAINPEEVRQAIYRSDVATLKLFNTAGVDFNDPSWHDVNGDSLLHIAAKNQDWETLDLLLTYKVEPDVLDAKGRTVTSVVMENGNILLAKRLLENGSLVDFLYSSGELALIQNLRDKNVGNVLTLINAGVDVNTISLDGETALYVALEEGLYEPMIALINAGADPNSLTPEKTTILAHICQSLPESPFNEADTTTIFKKLIDSGADITATSNRGWRPLQWCVKYKYIDGIHYLLGRDANVSGTLWIALNNEDYSTASLLLQRGADANEKGVNGLSPLMTMMRDNKLNMITELLNHGADPEEQSLEGQSALITAIVKKQTDVALALLSHPSRPAQHTTILKTPVEDSFKVLYEDNGKFGWYTRNAPGLTTLMVAVLMGDLKVVEKLINNGASRTKGTQNRYPVYPIQMAADRGDVKMQQLLIGVPYEDDKQVRHFIIDLSEQKVRYYKHGKLMKTSRVSTGRPGYRTKPGKLVITDRTRNKRSNIYDDAEMPYFQRFSCSAIGFHEGNTYSRYASHGCIRLPLSTAKYFWKEARPGDRVDIVK